MTNAEIEKWGHDLCEFLSDGMDCDGCGQNPPNQPIYFYRTSIDTIEGDYYCRGCVEKRIQGWQEEITQSENIDQPE